MADLTEDQKKLHAAAIAEGYKDETCAKCGLECLAFHHFIRCDQRPCPMLGGSPKSLLDMWAADCGVVCQAAKDDGVICADDECDRDNGVRPAPALTVKEG